MAETEDHAHTDDPQRHEDSSAGDVHHEHEEVTPRVLIFFDYA